ncbi:cytochrome C biogenesis protein [Congregibacter brevis]|uniref:Cytochrome C biogenesis protein n=1 Tax=Congregibacter brevis TaxID=3081201 RepID=A0ABZ0I943_9GAMM|nr:cytochrome C biogenesis protein [Congregibacter sp. IMCC45268]
MTGFLLGATVLCLIAAGLLLSRKSSAPRAADASDPNLGWYVQREKELEGEDTQLLDDARLRLLEDAGAGGVATELNDSGVRRLGFVLLVSVILVAGLIYQQVGSMEDVLIYEELSQLTPEDSDATREALLTRIAQRSRAREDNLQYLGLLGQLYMAGENFPAAMESFALLAEKAPEDPQALAMAAQARFLASDRELDDEAQLLAERALAVDPGQRTALGLLGMASFEVGAFGTAVNYWSRLQAQEEAGSPGYEMLAQAIAVAEERGGLASSVAPAKEADQSSSGISVSLSLPGGEVLDPQASVFVFARPAGAVGGMPIAVRRLRAGQLPISFRLSDGDSMAGQLLSQAGDVVVSAQISLNGQPGAANAAYTGAAAPISAGGDDAVVQIEWKAAGQGD